MHLSASPILSSSFLLLSLFLLLAGCGDKDELCRHDHQCREEQVCEPSGCAMACEEDQDCGFGFECLPRRVEEGKVCARR